MDVLQKIDGNKTYIIAILGGVAAIIHFVVTGDYSIAAMLQLVQGTALCGMFAALRHGLQKTQDAVGNGVNLTAGVQKGS